MALYVIGDLHLSENTGKEMDIFGGNWVGYRQKLKNSFENLNDEDVVVIDGDLSWGIDLQESLADFKFLEQFKGTKILVKGNHDLWWATISKMQKFFKEHDIQTLKFIQNDCYMYGDIALCGTRGWMFEEEKVTEHDRKILKREALRLEMSLEYAKKMGAKSIYCFLHYPPIFGNRQCDEVIDLMTKHNVSKCFYGHLHGSGHGLARQGNINGIEFRLISADFIGFKPFLIEKDV